jgi:hypothetical protein
MEQKELRLEMMALHGTLVTIIKLLQDLGEKCEGLENGR